MFNYIFLIFKYFEILYEKRKNRKREEKKDRKEYLKNE